MCGPSTREPRVPVTGIQSTHRPYGQPSHESSSRTIPELTGQRKAPVEEERDVALGVARHAVLVLVPGVQLLLAHDCRGPQRELPVVDVEPCFRV